MGGRVVWQRLTESAFRRLEVALSSLGIIVRSTRPGRQAQRYHRILAARAVHFTWGNAPFSKHLHGGNGPFAWGSPHFSHYLHGGTLLDRSWAVFGRSWAVSGRSWSGLGRKTAPITM